MGISSESILGQELSPPILKEVSIIAGTGNVNLNWKLQDSSDVFIYRNKIPATSTSPEWELISQIIDTSIQYYIDPSANADTMVRIYKLRAEPMGYDSEKFPTTLLTLEYDSCKSEIILDWTNYVNSIYNEGDISINRYEIIKTENSGLPEYIDQTTQKTYNVKNIEENTNYKFYINTIPDHALNSKSSSNSIDIYTQMPLSPDYINAISASVEGNNTNLKFEIAPDSELDTYKLLKSDSRTGSYDTLDTFETTDTEIITTHTDSDPDTKVSYYKLVSVNACGNETTNSDIINNIVLEVEQEGFNNTLSWNSFKEGSLIPANYYIYRIISNLDPELIGSFSNYNSFQDDIESLQSYSQFCYFVRATEEGTFENDYSQSNIVCVYLKPKVYIPEAFTPNGDDINDLFKPVFNFVPKDYELRIYNRWGNVIFETGDYTKAWNGKEPNGNSAPAGAYIYYLRIKSPNDQIVEERGNITVIYP